LSVVKKRLGDFKGTLKASVTTLEPREVWAKETRSVPIYIFENGKLRRCPNRSWSVFNLFSSQLAINSEIPRRGAWAVKEKFLPVVREPWGVGRGEGVAIFG
jgi:hypothetical protein